MFSNDNKALIQYSDSEKNEKKSDIIIILGYFIGITNEIRMGQHSVTVTWEFPDGILQLNVTNPYISKTICC